MVRGEQWGKAGRGEGSLRGGGRLLSREGASRPRHETAGSKRSEYLGKSIPGRQNSTWEGCEPWPCCVLCVKKRKETDNFLLLFSHYIFFWNGGIIQLMVQIKAYKLMSFHVCVYTWRHHYNQGNSIVPRDVLVPLCHGPLALVPTELLVCLPPSRSLHFVRFSMCGIIQLYSFLGLASFTHRNNSEIHSCCIIYQ